MDSTQGWEIFKFVISRQFYLNLSALERFRTPPVSGLIISLGKVR